MHIHLMKSEVYCGLYIDNKLVAYWNNLYIDNKLVAYWNNAVDLEELMEIITPNDTVVTTSWHWKSDDPYLNPAKFLPSTLPLGYRLDNVNKEKED